MKQRDLLYEGKAKSVYRTEKRGRLIEDLGCYWLGWNHYPWSEGTKDPFRSRVGV